jgi:hypothetical protein
MTRNLNASIGFMLLLAACQTTKQDEKVVTNPTVASIVDKPVDNQITEQQMSDGWKVLFDGKSLNGWRFYKGKENNSWEVLEGTLHSKPFDVANKRSDILTIEQYENFDLMFDWKISPQGNSGVMFRVSEDADEPYLTGPEYQVLDDKGYPGDVMPVQLTGANYGLIPPPLTKPINPVGEWNSSRIIVRGTHVEHWLNGTKLIEYELGSEAWRKLKAGSKWKEAKRYGTILKGYIDLQDHGSEVWYKNIYIKPL